MYLGILAVNTLYELNPFGTPTTRVRIPTGGSHWYDLVHVFGEVTAVEMSGMGSEQNYSYKTDFETRRENQGFRRQNISMSRLPLDSTPLGINTTNGKTSQIYSIPIGTKMPNPTPQTRPT